MPSENITFPNADGHRLSALIDWPLRKKPVAFVLFAHCFTCSKNMNAVGHISRALNAHDLAVLRFDFTGLGQSEGDFEDTNFSSNVSDLVYAARFLEEAYEAPAVLIGHSLGGAAVLQAAEDIPSARAVVTIAAPADPNHVAGLLESSLEEIETRGEATVRLAGRAFTIKKQFLDDLESSRMTVRIHGLHRPLLVLHSPVDNTVGVENAGVIFMAARHPKSYVSLDHADHLLSDEQDARYVGSLIGAWVSKYLDEPDEPAASELEEDRVVVQTGASGYRTEIMAGLHTLVADEPTDVGGTDAGPTPYELLSAALGACTSMTLRMYADRKRWPVEEITVRLAHRKIYAQDCKDCDTRDGKIDHIDREIELTGNLDEEQRARMVEIADKCPVHRTLSAHVEIETRLAEASP